MVHPCRGPLSLPHSQREALPIYPGPILRSIPPLCCMPGHNVSPFTSPLPTSLQVQLQTRFSGGPISLCSFRLLQSVCGLQSQSPCLGYKGTSFRNSLSTLSVSSLSRWVRWAHLPTAGLQALHQPSVRFGLPGVTVPCSLCLCTSPSDTPHSSAAPRRTPLFPVNSHQHSLWSSR